MSCKEILSSVSQFLVRYEDFKLGKCIGKGAYGEVFLAEHTPTRTKCALKRLKGEVLADQNLLYFCREVLVLANCRNYFLLPFLGYSDTPPYLIVTEYVPCGSLYDALQHAPNAPVLTGTHKTLIAMGIAYGMASLHEKNIIHRDLKSLNILLDDKLLPKVCDFGIARFVGGGSDQASFVTQKIGTPHWMAPETFESNTYDNKVDVYSYAMMLWEMVTEKVPYQGMSAPQVMMFVCGNKRPELPANTPSDLRKLIEMCWDHDPTHRPSFKQIYEKMSRGFGMFAGTDAQAVAALVRHIHQFDPSAPAPVTPAPAPAPAPVPTPVPVPVPALPVNVSPKVDAAAPAYPQQVEGFNGNIPVDLVNTLRNPNATDFCEKIRYAGPRIDLATSAIFFSAIRCVFYEPVSSTVMKVTLSEILRVISSDPDIIAQLLDVEILPKLPLENQSMNELTFRIIVKVVQTAPEAVTADIIRRMLLYTETEGQKLVSVMSELALQAAQYPKCMQAIFPFIEMSGLFIVSRHAPGYIRVLTHLLVHCSHFVQTYLRTCLDIFKAGLRSAMIETQKASYAAMSKVQPMEIPVDMMCKHLRVKEMTEDICGILMRMQNLPSSKDLIDALIDAGQHSQNITYLLCKAVETPQNLKDMLQDFRWMTGPVGPSGCFLVMLRIFTRKELRPYITSAMPLATLLRNVAANEKPEELMAISTAVRRMDQSRELLRRFSESKFLDVYIQACMKSKNPEVMNSCLVMVYSMIRIAHVPAFTSLIPAMPDVFNAKGQTMINGLSTCVMLAYYPQTRQVFTDNAIPQMVQMLHLPPEYERHRAEFLKNFSCSFYY